MATTNDNQRFDVTADDRASRSLTRRDVLASLAAGASALLARPADARQQNGHSYSDTDYQIARGTVFDDHAGDGVRTSASRGIANVMVSNGRDVTLSDADGAWTLPVRPGESVFVIKPAQWRIGHSATTGQRAHAGCYLYDPTALPKSDLAARPARAALGPLPTSIDFPLIRQAEPQQFDVLLVADTQAANATELAYVRAELQHCMTASKPAFAIHHGDVMGDDLTLLPQHLAMTRETMIPWYHCPGNHDMDLDSTSHSHAFETWKRAIGQTHTAFSYGGATFILLNNIEYFGHGSNRSAGRGYRGVVGEDQLQFVANVLRHIPKDDLVVVSMHIPLVSFEMPESISDTTADRRRLLELLSTRKHTVSFAGHSHTTEHHYLGLADGFSGNAPHHHHVLTATCGSWWSGPLDSRGVPTSDSRDGTPKGAHVLSINGNSYATRLVTSPCADGAPLRAIVSAADDPAHARRASTIESTAPQLIVDVFDGGPRTQVVCRSVALQIDRAALERTVIEDPHIVETFGRHKGLNKPWVEPAPSSHIWTMPIPADFDGDRFDITISVTTEFGGQYEVVTDVDMPVRSAAEMRI